MVICLKPIISYSGKIVQPVGMDAQELLQGLEAWWEIFLEFFSRAA
jgi:hypothetical protein